MQMGTSTYEKLWVYHRRYQRNNKLLMGKIKKERSLDRDFINRMGVGFQVRAFR